MSAHLTRILPVFLLAGVLQCLLLATAVGPPDRTIGAALMCAVVLVLPLAGLRWMREPSVIHLLVAGCLGGLGMALGAAIDTATGSPGVHCFSLPTSWANWTSSFLNWAFGLMLAGCVAGCFFLCPRRWAEEGAAPLSQLACTLGMCLGMMAGGVLMADRWTARAVSEGELHVIMVLAMLAGVCGATYARSYGRALKVTQ